MKTMPALVKRERKEGLWLEEVPTPTYGINDVMIEVLKTGICGTDVHIYNWDAWAQKTIKVPTVAGHEFVGRIEAVGSNVSGLEVGELVSAEGHIVCGHCRNCLAGRRHLCAHTVGVGVTDVNPYRLKLAASMGASAAVDVSKEDIHKVMERLRMTEGFDVGFEMSGNPNALRMMLETMAHGGKIAMLGIQPENTGIDW